MDGLVCACDTQLDQLVWCLVLHPIPFPPSSISFGSGVASIISNQLSFTSASLPTSSLFPTPDGVHAI